MGKNAVNGSIELRGVSKHYGIGPQGRLSGIRGWTRGMVLASSRRPLPRQVNYPQVLWCVGPHRPD